MAAVDHLVLEQPVVEQRDADCTVGCVDEPAGHERRQACLVGATLRGEAPPDDGERALGVGCLDRRRGAVPVPGGDGRGRGSRARRGPAGSAHPCGARTWCAPPARRARPNDASTTARLLRRATARGTWTSRRARLARCPTRAQRRRRRGPVHDGVVGGRRVVVRVATVAPVDQVVARVRRGRRRRSRSNRFRRRDRRRPRGARWPRRWCSTRELRWRGPRLRRPGRSTIRSRPPDPVEHRLSYRRVPLVDVDGCSGVAEPEELLADSLEVDRGFAGCGFVEREFVGTVRRAPCVRPARR